MTFENMYYVGRIALAVVVYLAITHVGKIKQENKFYKHTIPNAVISSCEQFRDTSENHCRQMPSDRGSIDSCLQVIEKGYKSCVAQARPGDF